MPENRHDPGPLLNLGQVTRHVRDRLELLVPRYLVEVDAQETEGGRLRAGQATGAPAWFVPGDDGGRRKRGEQRPPVGRVVLVGQTDELERHGRTQRVRAWWQIDVELIVGGATEDGVNAVRDRTAAATRAVLAHQLPAPGLIRAARLVEGEEPFEVEIAGGSGAPRRMAAHVIPVAVQCDVVDERPGMPTDWDPEADPGARPAYRTPSDVNVDVRATTRSTP